MIRFKTLFLAAVSVAGVAAPANALNTTQTGTRNGLTWTAQSTIIGQTPTGSTVGSGDPIYLAQAPKYSGTVGILMDYGAGGRFVCSGSLLSDRRSILTAGHCVSGGAGTANPLRTTVFFDPGNDPNASIYSATTPPAGVVGVTVAQYHVNSAYTGEVIDQNDIAVLTLSDFAPTFAQAYEIYTGSDLTGVDLNVAGYGNRSAVGGAEGTTGLGAGQGTGRRRQGDNRYDFRLGDADFDGFFTDVGADGENFFGTAQIDYSYLTDFDNGLAANDASCVLASGPDGLGLAASGKYCNLGRGLTEAVTAGGDSGGPQFVDGQVASVTSYGLSFGTDYGDFKAGLNNSWGEFAGYVPTSIHSAFIAAAMAEGVPEPTTWAQMMLGFGLLGGALRTGRRKALATAL